MSKICVFADSSCDYSPQQAKENNFSLVPLNITFDDKTYTDYQDITPDMFFNMLSNTKTLPKTSQPSPEAFMNAFKECWDYDHILCLCLTSKSSGTFQSASMAKSMLEEEGFTPQIHVFDTYNASCAFGLFAEKAGLMARAGKSIEEILNYLEEIKNKMSLYFILDTLEYVRKGGRIGNISGIVGELLGIKPILTFLNGSPVNVDKSRGFAQAKTKLINKFLDTAKNIDEVTIVHSSAEKAKELAEDLRKIVKDIVIHFHEAGPVIGTYAGSGAIGLAFEEKQPRWV